MPNHPALAANRVAVITGAASGIGLAASAKFAALGMRVCMADANGAALEAAAARVRANAASAGHVRSFAVDVSNPDDVKRLKASAYDAFGEVALLMNNAGTGGGGELFGDPARFRRIIDVNLIGVVNGVQAFAPDMIAQGTDAAIVSTGSKQGITCPPGDTAYNVSKAGVKVATEALAHELRNIEGCRVSAHLLIPGFTFTGMTAGSRPRSRPPRGRPNMWSISCSIRWGRGTSTSSVPTTTCRARWTSAGFFGPPATSSRTGRRSPAGTPPTETPSPNSRKAEPANDAGRRLADVSRERVRG